MAAPVDQKLSEAVALHRSGKVDEAEQAYRAVLDMQPDHADACALLGVVVGLRGDLEEAQLWVNRAVALDPDASLLRFHQGTVLMAALKMPDAIEAFRHALLKQPDMAPIHFNLANALRASGDWHDAIFHYREALRCDDRFLDAYNNLALSLVHEKQYDEAMDLSLRAVALNPDFGPGWLTACNVAEKIQNYDVALRAGKRATDLMPGNHFAWFGYGIALNRVNRDVEALAAYQTALKLSPRRVDIWDNLGQTYQSLGKVLSAENAYLKAVDVAGQTIDDEEDRLARGEEIDELEYGGRHWHLALIELLLGKYPEGFARYRSRFKEIKELKRLSLPYSLWKGEDLTGKTLLVCDEQGYGDTLMLARYLPHLCARGVKIIFLVHKILVPLFQNWNGANLVVPHGGFIPGADFMCSSFDLPHRLQTTVETIPQTVPYLPCLEPDASTVLPDKMGPAKGLKIGVVWGGSPLHLNDGKRSIPLNIFQTLFDLEDVRFYSFNRDLKDGDAELLPHCRIETVVPLLTDFAAASRLIGQMDLVITVDTATAHLAGGMGKKIFVLLPFAPDWRWLTTRQDSPWYPTATLFRQTVNGEWRDVIDAVKAAIKNLPRA